LGEAEAEVSITDTDRRAVARLLNQIDGLKSIREQVSKLSVSTDRRDKLVAGYDGRIAACRTELDAIERRLAKNTVAA
jgi:primosomal protein N''